MNIENTNIDTTQVSTKSATVTLLLCIFLGSLGAHRFYVGKFFTGILMLLTAGGLGIWYLIDLALIISNRFCDRKGNIIELAKNPTPFKKIMTVFAAFIVLFYGFLISMVVTTILATNTLTSIAQNQLDALRSNDIHKAYSYTSKDFQTTTPLSAFKKFSDQYKLETNESVSFNNRNIKNDTGDIIGTLKFKNGSSIQIEYTLKKENGQWKILGIGLKSIP